MLVLITCMTLITLKVKPFVKKSNVNLSAIVSFGEVP